MTPDQKNRLNAYAELVKLNPDNESHLRKYLELLLKDRRLATAADTLRQLHALLLEKGEQEQAEALIIEFPEIGRIRNPEAPYEDRIDTMLPAMMQNNLWLKLHQRKIQEGHHLIRRGQHEETLYLVCEGELAEITQNSDGKPVLLNLIGKGNVVGESYLFNPGAHLSDIVANCDSVIVKLPRKRMLAALKSNPTLKIILRRKSEARRTATRISVCPLLQNVPLEIRKRLAELSHTHDYRLGQKIHAAGEQLDFVELLAKGSINVQLQEKGNYSTLKTLGPGALVGESEVTHAQGAPADMVANSNVTMVRIPYAEFMKVVQAHPPLHKALLEYAEKNQAQMMRKLNELSE